jgi:hypothetical protein
MTSDSTWRKHPFKIGDQYLARESFDGLTSDLRTRKFQAKQIYTLLHIDERRGPQGKRIDHLRGVLGRQATVLPGRPTGPTNLTANSECVNRSRLAHKFSFIFNNLPLRLIGSP